MTREVVFDSHRVHVDPSEQRLRLWIDEPLGHFHMVTEPELRPTPPRGKTGFVAATILVQKAKQFDDGLYAAVELAAQRGAGAFAGKASLVRAVLDRLVTHQKSASAIVPIAAAAGLGGIATPAVPQLEADIAAETSAFLADEMRSKPLGFYTWSPELEAIFRQDRLLQGDISDRNAERDILEAVAADPAASAAFTAYLTLISKLTNPLVERGPRGEFRVFPPSASHEGDLITRLYGASPIPEDFSLIDEMIKRIRAGTLSLAPSDASGWYDYQTWAHEPFVIPEKMPEAARLELDEKYRERLLDVFKGAQALARETHVKQLDITRAGMALGARPKKEPVILVVRPDLGVEPVPAYYLRRADSYRFVRHVLDDAFGAGALTRMARVGPDGRSATDLDSELAGIERLFRGAYVASCRQIGLALDPAASAAADDDERDFTSWAARIAGDPDVGQDVRMMVPIFFDEARHTLKVWAFLGWTTDEVKVNFRRPPRVSVFDRSGRPIEQSDDLKVVFGLETHAAARPVTAEVYVDALLNRTEFRALCDRLKTRSAILGAVGHP